MIFLKKFLFGASLILFVVTVAKADISIDNTTPGDITVTIKSHLNGETCFTKTIAPGSSASCVTANCCVNTQIFQFLITGSGNKMLCLVGNPVLKGNATVSFNKGENKYKCKCINTVPSGSDNNFCTLVNGAY